MNKTEQLDELRDKAKSNYLKSIANTDKKELSYLRNCIKNDLFDIEWFEDVEESGMFEIGVGVDCEEFKLQMNVSVELTKEDETNYSQLDLTDIQIDNILNFKGEQIEWCDKTEYRILIKIKKKEMNNNNKFYTDK